MRFYMRFISCLNLNFILIWKQHFGLVHYQSYLGMAIDRFIHLAFIACCLFGLFQRNITPSRCRPFLSLIRV